MNFFKKKYILFSTIFLTLAISASYLYTATTPPGYCRSQNRHISDDEFIKIATNLLEKDMSARPEKKHRHYLNWDFDKNNSNCCRVDRFSAQPSITNRLGKQKIIVWLNPKTSTWPINIEGDVLAKLYFDECGKIIPSDDALFY